MTNQLLTFPNVPNIFWKVNEKEIIKLMVNFDQLKKLIGNKKLCFLFPKFGLLETSYCALILEAYHKLFPENELFWNGPREFASLIRLQNLASYIILPNNFDLTFPTPIHSTKDFVYFNLFYHLSKKRMINGTLDKKIIHTVIGKQIWSHSFLPLSSENQIIIRSNFSSESQKLKNSLNLKSKFIIFLPFKNHWSNVKHHYLFGSRQMLELASAGQKIIVFYNQKLENNYPHPNIFYLPFSFDLFISLLPQTSALFSAMVDFHHLIGLLKYPIYNFYYQTKKSYNPLYIENYFGYFWGAKNVITPQEVISALGDK